MVKKKMVIPEHNADCLMYKEIDSDILSHLRALERFNDGMLEVFWELNTHERT